MLWSDGVIRSEDYQGGELYKAIRSYFNEAVEERLLELKWENEALRAELDRRNKKLAVAIAAAVAA